MDRRTLIISMAALITAGCGGGAESSDPPQIQGAQESPGNDAFDARVTAIGGVIATIFTNAVEATRFAADPKGYLLRAGVRDRDAELLAPLKGALAVTSDQDFAAALSIADGRGLAELAVRQGVFSSERAAHLALPSETLSGEPTGYSDAASLLRRFAPRLASLRKSVGPMNSAQVFIASLSLALQMAELPSAQGAAALVK